MTPMNLEVGMSASASSGASAGAGDIVLSGIGGGARANNTFWYILGGVAVLGVIAWLVLRKK